MDTESSFSSDTQCNHDSKDNSINTLIENTIYWSAKMKRVLNTSMIVLAVSLPAWADTVYVQDGSTCTTNCGGSWAAAYDEINDALANASTQNPPEIWVAAGTYAPIALDANHNGIKLFGGFYGTETLSSQRDPWLNICTIDAGNSGVLVVESIGNDASTEISGFTITGGYLSGLGYGAGMNLINSSLLVSDCIITGNGGGAIGGGVAIREGSPEFHNCQFVDNNRVYAGGAVYIRLAAAKFVNCLFHANQAKEGGGISHYSDQTSTFINCVFANNIATVGKGGAIFDVMGTAVLHNCIVWGNTSPKSGTESIASGEGVSTTVLHSVVQDDDPNDANVYPGTGNLDDDPLFVLNPDDGGDGWGDDSSTPSVDESANDDFGDLHLLASSPCLDGGDNSFVIGISTDFDGYQRVFDSDADGVHTVDMGAYELIIDCDGNGINDDKDLADCSGQNVWCLDCNTNGTLDTCDIASGASEDCGSNGIPDECESPTLKACCLPSSQCTNTWQACCAEQSGTWKPTWTCHTLPPWQQCGMGQQQSSVFGPPLPGP